MLFDLPTLFTARVSCAALVAATLTMLAGPPSVRAQQATPDGDPFLVNGPAVTDGGQEDPDISRTGSGYVIVWESDAEVNEVIWGQRYDDDGNRVGDNFNVSVFDESQIDPVVSRADDFVVVWQNTDGNDIWGQRFDANGDKVPPQFPVNTFADNEQEHPAIASDDLGDFVVIYESFDFLDLNEGDEIVGQRFSATGVRQGHEFLVNNVLNGDQQDPAVARRPDGSFLVAWESDDGEGLGENSGIYARPFGPNGEKGDQFRVNLVPDGNQESPDVGAWEGGYVVAWESDDGEGKGVWARRFDPNGEPIDDAEFLVNTIQDLDQRDPAVSVFDGGEFVVVWQDDDFGSLGQEFNAAGEELGEWFDISVSEKIEEKPRVQVREAGFMATWFGAGAEPDNDVFGRNYVVPEPGSALLGLAALSTLAVLARTRRSRFGLQGARPEGGVNVQLIAAGSFVRNPKLATALAAGAVAIGLLLGASAAQAEVVIIDPGSVGNQATRSPFVLEDHTNTLELRFADNKTLEFGSMPPLIFSIQSNQVNTPYQGFLTDELGNQIAGTDFVGSTEAGATQVLLDEFTVWSGLTVIGEWVDADETVYEIFWINSPKPIVGQVDAAGNQTPTADAGGSVTGVAGAAVGFDGSASSDPDGNIVSWEWDFGDDENDTGETPSHTYADAGIYNVTLTVTDDDDAADSAPTTAVIGEGSQPPTADANGPYNGTAGAAVTFDGTASSDPDGGIASYDWDFGDDDTGTGATPSHTYAVDGVYDVTLTVTDTTSGVLQVFVTSGAYKGNFGDQAGGDTACTAAATDAGLSGTWTAWLGRGSCGACMDPRDRILDGEYQLLDETVVANTKADLLDGTLDAPINMDETGTVLEGAFEVWTGTDPDGTGASGPGTCTVWTTNSNSTRGQSGTANAADATWTDNLSETCGVFNRLYCFAEAFVPIANEGETAMDTTTATIGSGNQAPIADAGPPAVGTASMAVAFDGSGSDDLDGTVTGYAWDFGDGNTGTSQNPIHTYSLAGDFTVILTVTDDDSAMDSDTTSASIDSEGANLPPTADPGGPYTGDEAVAVNFDGSASSDPDGSIAQHDWDFGDGNTAIDGGLTPSNTYADAGNYDVTLTVTDDDGATDSQVAVAAIGVDNVPPTADSGGPYPGAVNQPVNFDGSGSGDSDGILVSAEWDFGDGEPGSGLFPTHTYTDAGPYTANLTVTDNDGATGQSSAQVVIGDGVSLPPTADADGPYGGVAGAPVTFDGTASDDPDGTIADYAWEFGDDNTGTGQMPDNTYIEGGVKNVILDVTDDDGLTSSDSTTAVIGESSLRPTADANGPYNGTVGAAVTFDATASTDADGTIVSWEWDFGDGNNDTGEMPSNTYAEDGTYIVKLTVTDNSGEGDVDVTVAVVGIGNLPPSADADGPYPGEVGVPVSFDGSGSQDLDGMIVSYEWDFGDDTMLATEKSPDHSYDAAGAYFVTLTVTDNMDAVGSDGTLVTIPEPSPGLSMLAALVTLFSLARSRRAWAR